MLCLWFALKSAFIQTCIWIALVFSVILELLSPSIACAQNPPAKRVEKTTLPTTKRAPSTPTKSQPTSQKTFDLKGLKKQLSKLVKKHKLQGVGLAIVDKDNVIWQGGLGFADVKKKKKVTADTVFRVGSISKSFLALTFLKWAEEGKLTLNDNIKGLVGDVVFKNPWSKEAPIKIVHLLEHTSGFDDMHFNELYNIHHKPDISMKDALAIDPRARTARWKPGTWISYSNPAYGLAGYILEKKAKCPFEDVIRDVILRPLGMKTASFRLTKALKQRLAQGYEPGPQNKKVPYYHIYHRPAGSLHASPKEMAKFVQFLLRRGKLASGKQLLKPTSIIRMETPMTALSAKKGFKNTYGLGNYVGFIGGLKTHGHNGGIDGFISTARYSLDAGMGYVILLNSVNGAGLKEIQKAIAESIAAFKKPRLATIKKQKPASLKKYVGTYQQIHSRNQLFDFARTFGWLRVRLEKGKLYREQFTILNWSGKKELLPLGDGRFRTKTEADASHAFVKDDKGKTLMFIGFGAFRKQAAVWPPLIGIWIVCTILLMASSILFMFVWIPRRLFTKASFPFLWARSVPLFAVLSLFGAVASMSFASLPMLTRFSLYSGLFTLCTSLFALFSVAGLYTAYRSVYVTEMNTIARVHSIMLSLANVSFMLLIWPMIGLRFWAGW